jgi:RNA polymerase sigma factor (sigma-70 family)
MTVLASTDARLSDADLITASRSGDRQAFGQIIRKYQAMVSGLIYASCGDLHRSEDVAQDTFISAWKSLSGLRDASKLPGWLCQIARRRLADVSRKPAEKEIPFSQAFASGHEPVAPASETLQAEEYELLWKTLSRIPQPYRETLVLFYRQGQSTAEVAAAMETSEDSIRQRLTRGRQMLRDEVVSMLERNIARTAPTPLFATQVVAALPALAAQVAGVSAAAKGSAAAGSTGILTIIFCWVVPISIFLSMIFGTFRDIRDARSPDHRKIAKQTWALMWVFLIAWIIGFNWLMAIGHAQAWTLENLTWAAAGGSTFFGIGFFTIVTLGKWRVDKVLAEEGLREAPFPKLPLAIRLFATAPVVAICCGWMVRLALSAGDQLGTRVIVAMIAAISIYLAYRLPKTQPDRAVLHTFETFSFCLLAIVVMINWRLQYWIPGAPLWNINLCAAVLFIWTAVFTLLSRPPQMTNDPPAMTISPNGQTAAQ